VILIEENRIRRKTCPTNAVKSSCPVGMPVMKSEYGGGRICEIRIRDVGISHLA
jgi:hypothetical protein